jgi:hypothetical protein
MTDHLIRFFGHIIEIKRPDGFPRTVWYDKIVRVEKKEELQFEINKEATMIIVKQRGMIVTKDQDPAHIRQADDMSFESRIFVPMEMMAYIDCEVKDITGETPNYEDGIAFVGSGIERKELKAN